LQRHNGCYNGDMKTLAPAEIRTLRGGLSRAEFARLVGCHPETVAQWERGAQAPQGIALKALNRLSALGGSAQPPRPTPACA